jgi:ABC-type Na+ transport system ATPase subunit NatA
VTVAEAREEPLLVLDRARILAGGAAGEPLTARGGVSRLTLVGSLRPIFRLLARDATLASGEARLVGVPLRDAVPAGVAGLALSDPPLPGDWTPERYLFESARLAGFRERDARREVDAAITRFELAAYARRRLADSYVAVKRVVLLANATLGSPPVICAEAPLAELDPSASAYVDAALERAAHGRRLFTSVTSAAHAERLLVERADWVIVAHGGIIGHEGPPDVALAASTRYAATVTRSADAFVAALASAGARATPADVAPALLGFVPRDPTAVRRVLVELPAGGSPDAIVRAARDADAPLVELKPV